MIVALVAIGSAAVAMESNEVQRVPMEPRGPMKRIPHARVERDALHGRRPRPHEAIPACSGGACGIRCIEGGRGPNFQQPRKKTEKAETNRKKNNNKKHRSA